MQVLEQNEVWRVSAYSHDPLTADAMDSEPDADGMYTLYDHFFSSREKAHAIYAAGEKAIGVEHGLHWHIKRIVVDPVWAQDQLDELIAELNPVE